MLKPDLVSLEENMKRMKAAFKESRLALNELALIVTTNNKNTIGCDSDKNFLTKNAIIQSQEVLDLIESIESKTKEEPKTLVDPKTKEKSNKYLIYIIITVTSVLILLFFLIKRPFF